MNARQVIYGDRVFVGQGVSVAENSVGADVWSLLNVGVG